VLRTLTNGQAIDCATADSLTEMRKCIPPELRWPTATNGDPRMVERYVDSRDYLAGEEAVRFVSTDRKLS